MHQFLKNAVTIAGGAISSSVGDEATPRAQVTRDPVKRVYSFA